MRIIDEYIDLLTIKVKKNLRQSTVTVPDGHTA